MLAADLFIQVNTVTDEQRKAKSRERQRRYRLRVSKTAAYKTAAAARMRAWRKSNPEKWVASNKAWAEKNHDKTVVYLREWRKQNPGYVAKSTIEKGASYAASRRARKNAAMPPWVDRAVIAAVYRQAKTLSLETGIEWHVDHIVPLKHKLVCGLHVVANLQVLPGAENISKGNRFVVN